MDIEQAKVSIGKDVIYFPKIYDKELIEHTKNTKICRIKSTTDGDYVEVETDHGCMYFKARDIELRKDTVNSQDSFEQTFRLLSLSEDTQNLRFKIFNADPSRSLSEMKAIEKWLLNN